jgi:hypothetical protein
MRTALAALPYAGNASLAEGKRIFVRRQLCQSLRLCEME